ncbi:MAG: HAD family phosphatase [Candidatus Gracilibacteria bacterium]|nr:HAD family phosphatase [Candidatus Gracilibacteria bacterium]
MIKAIIFDFGGVFSTDDDIREFWQNNAEKLGVDAEEANRISLSIWFEARVGKIDSTIFWEKLGAFTKMSPESFKKYFIEYTGFRDELHQFVKKNLYGKYKLAILSNQIESWLEPILEEKKFREIFDIIITSYNTGLVKPDREIYEKVIQDLNLKAEECIYIEDRPKNLEPAKNLGMNVIEFRDYDSFLKELDFLLK